MLDLRSGYHAIPIREEDRDKTAFITRRGCFRYKVLPFGLTTAPSVFQRLMDLVLCGLTYVTCSVYLDEIIVYSRDFDTHVQRLQEVLEKLRGANLKLHVKKCCLFRRKVAFLGYVLSEAGIEVQADKVATVRDWPTPRSLSELRSFRGYVRITGASSEASPTSLQRQHVPFTWTSEQEEAFNLLKERLTSAPVLGMPTDDGTFILDSGASDVGLGAVLSQKQGSSEVVIAYASRSLSRAERNYDVTRRELLAIVYGLTTYKQYLLGRHFMIISDHAALQWLRRTPEPMAQLARWLVFIEQFDFELLHRPGIRHGNADGLSRKPPTPDDSSLVRVTSGDASVVEPDSVQADDTADVLNGSGSFLICRTSFWLTCSFLIQISARLFVYGCNKRRSRASSSFYRSQKPRRCCMVSGICSFCLTEYCTDGGLQTTASPRFISCWCRLRFARITSAGSTQACVAVISAYDALWTKCNGEPSGSVGELT